MMSMQFGLLARQRHYESIQHALGPRPEPCGQGQGGPTSTKRSITGWPHIMHVLRWPVHLIPRVTSSRRA
jgi:hypothetical protein